MKILKGIIQEHEFRTISLKVPQCSRVVNVARAGAQELVGRREGRSRGARRESVREREPENAQIVDKQVVRTRAHDFGNC